MGHACGVERVVTTSLFAQTVLVLSTVVSAISSGARRSISQTQRTFKLSSLLPPFAPPAPSGAETAMQEQAKTCGGHGNHRGRGKYGTESSRFSKVGKCSCSD